MTNPWPDTGTLATIASVIMAFAAAMLFFRLQREHKMAEDGERNWIPWADRLLLGAGGISLVAVILPIVMFPPTWGINRVIAPAGGAASVVLIVGYVPSIFAHYRYLFGIGRFREEPRDNPEPPEGMIVIATVVAALISAVVTAYLHAVA
ncbi:hypothetical protein [Burkholderia cenocepacia]|uniref:hypothetical protein n=1 Tax=Burkholderia cenocepacia TaxID=95486 RepID=UPI002AAF8BED|nr:hypothetical protein [Burkholderia cenocepacia]